jgi:hypothetical protein
MFVTLGSWEAEVGRIADQGQSSQIALETPISKITRAKWTGGVASGGLQGEALSSNPNLPQNCIL